MMKKIKILAVMPTNTYGYAGAEKVVLNVLSGLNDNKFDISLVEILRVNKSLKRGAPKINTNFGVKYQIRVHRGIKSVPALSRIIKEVNPDIIYSNVSHINFDTLLAKWLAFSRAKFVSCIHGIDSGRLVDKIALYFPSIFSYRTIVVSKGIKELLVKKYHVSSKKIVMIYNPVINFQELEIKLNYPLASKDKIWPDRKFNLIAVGRLEKEKGHYYLIKAMNLIVNKNKMENVNLIIVGEGQLKKELIKLVINYRLTEHIFFVGWQDNVFKFLKHADVLVLPSLREGFSIVIVEALACGIPVVSSNCKSGPREILAPNTDFNFQTKSIEVGEYGILVPPKNPNALARGIIRLLGDFKLREKYSQTGKIRVNDFSFKKIIPQYEKLFESLINN